MPQNSDPFKDRDSEDLTRDNILLGIFVSLLCVVLVFGFMRLNQDYPREAIEITSSEDVALVACPPDDFKSFKAKNEEDAFRLLETKLLDLSGEWVIADFPVPGPTRTQSDGLGDIARYIYLDSQLVGEVLLEKGKNGELLLDVVWKC